MQFCAHRANSPEKTNGTIETADLELSKINACQVHFRKCAFYKKTRFSIRVSLQLASADSEPPFHGGSEKYRVCMHPTSGSKVIQIIMRPPSTSKAAVLITRDEVPSLLTLLHHFTRSLTRLGGNLETLIAISTPLYCTFFVLRLTSL